jgi:polyisoprenoid-binding protein YceI
MTEAKPDEETMMILTRLHFPALFTSALLAALAACAPLPQPAAPPATAAAAAPAHAPAPAPATPKAPAPAPAPTPAPAPADPLAALAAGPKILHIDPQRSLIAITVRRGGAFARFGHDHVVASHTLSGQVDLARRRTDFQFRLDQMTVDEADLRRQAGLDTQPGADAIEGTRHNMLTKVLDAEHYPLAQIHATLPAPGQPLQAAITLHGVTRTLPLPVTWRAGASELAVEGTLTLRQTDFGLVPYSLMGGALAVQDQMELRFTIIARP